MVSLAPFPWKQAHEYLRAASCTIVFLFFFFVLTFTGAMTVSLDRGAQPCCDRGDRGSGNHDDWHDQKEQTERVSREGPCGEKGRAQERRNVATTK